MVPGPHACNLKTQKSQRLELSPKTGKKKKIPSQGSQAEGVLRYSNNKLRFLLFRLSAFQLVA